MNAVFEELMPNKQNILATAAIGAITGAIAFVYGLRVSVFSIGIPVTYYSDFCAVAGKCLEEVPCPCTSFLVENFILDLIIWYILASLAIYGWKKFKGNKK